MDEFIKGMSIGGKMFIACAKYHVKQPNTYLAAGAAGLGVFIASKKVNEGLSAAGIAMTGIIGYTYLETVSKSNRQDI